MGGASARDPFAGGDQVYLREVQYRDSTRLAARARLHVKYGTARVAWFPWVATQIDWPAGARVLEVGCGAGWLWAEASAHLPGGLRLTLTDLSRGMVTEAVGRVAGLGRHRRVEGRIADVQALPFAARSFDVVVANHMLYHVPDPGLAVSELARVVRPDGVLIAGTVGPSHLRELAEIRAEVFGGPCVLPTVDTFGIEVGEPMLRGCFADVEWRHYDDWLDCTDPDDVLAFLASTPPVEGASQDDHHRVVEAVHRRFAAGGGRMRISKETGVFVCAAPGVGSPAAI
jgi:ubiquinone/menaquinone biosynthesis C-methylase UbiE